MALTSIPAAGAKLRGSVLSALITEGRAVYGIKSSDQNVGPSNTTYQDVTELGLAVVANAIYELSLYLQYSTNTTADFKFTFTAPTGATGDLATEYFHTTESWVTAKGGLSTNYTPGGTGTCLQMQGSVTTGANAGTLQLQAAQSTSTAVTTNVETGSVLILRRVS